MRYRALVLLGIAVVLGGLAAFMVSQVLNREIAVQAEMKPQKVEPAVVAAVDLPVGTKLEAVQLRVADLPVDAYPAGSYRKVEEVIGGDKPSVVISEIHMGEVVLPNKLSTGVMRRGLTARIPDGMRAISIPVNEVRGVGGFVLPGDRVDVLHTTAIGRKDNKVVTRTLLQNMVVLGVDQVSSDNEEKPIVVNVVTLLANPDQAKTLTLAQKVGDLTLSLRNEGDSDSDTSETVALNDLWSYGATEKPTATRSTPRRKSDSGRSLVELIRGLSVSNESVVAAKEMPADDTAQTN